jgi:hypothetical protein
MVILQLAACGMRVAIWFERHSRLRSTNMLARRQCTNRSNAFRTLRLACQFLCSGKKSTGLSRQLILAISLLNLLQLKLQ